MGSFGNGKIHTYLASINVTSIAPLFSLCKSRQKTFLVQESHEVVNI